MAVYEMKCPKCGIIEVEHPMGEPHPDKCQCGSDITRVFLPPNIVYKGSGFYKNDSILDNIDPMDRLEYEDGGL